MALCVSPLSTLRSLWGRLTKDMAATHQKNTLLLFCFAGWYLTTLSAVCQSMCRVKHRLACIAQGNYKKCFGLMTEAFADFHSADQQTFSPHAQHVATSTETTHKVLFRKRELCGALQHFSAFVFSASNCIGSLTDKRTSTNPQYAHLISTEQQTDGRMEI